MHEFDYFAPTDLKSALALFSEHRENARPLAGGTDLIDQMRIGKHTPCVVIDVKKISELNSMGLEQDLFRIGAAVSCRQIQNDSTVKRTFTALADSCHIIGGVQIQTRASVGGNLCNSGPAADSIPSLIVLGAGCLVASESRTRLIPISEFCTGPSKNQLESNEILVDIRLPLPKPNTGSHYRRMIPRNEMDIAVVGVAARVTLNETCEFVEDAALSLAAVGPTPLDCPEAVQTLIGNPANETEFSKVAEAAKQLIRPIDDMRGTVDYRTHITGVLTERVLQAAAQRARGETLSYRPGT